MMLNMRALFELKLAEKRGKVEKTHTTNFSIGYNEMKGF